MYCFSGCLAFCFSHSDFRKTGWASNAPATAEVITSEEFPEDYAERIQNANAVFEKINGTGLVTVSLNILPPSFVNTSATGANSSVVVNPVQSVAEAALNAALGLGSSVPPVSTISTSFTATKAATPTAIKTVSPTQHILVRNMFDKDEETDDRWWDDIKEDVEEECSKYGKVTNVVVMHTIPGGMVYVSFEREDMAKAAATALEGRWFAQRQLHVEYVSKNDIASCPV